MVREYSPAQFFNIITIMQEIQELKFVQGLKVVKQFLNDDVLIQVELLSFSIIEHRLKKPKYVITTFFRHSKEVHQTEPLCANDAILLLSDMIHAVTNSPK